MRISVIVPAYREGEAEAHLIHRTAREPKVSEVVVSAFRCTPAFHRVLRNIPKVRTLEAPEKGRGAQMNFGAAAAKGDLFLFLHADSFLEEGALDEMEESLRKKRFQGGAFRIRLDHPGTRYRFKAWCANQRSQRLGMPYGDQGYFMTRELYESLGGFKEMPLFEDVELFGRLKKIGLWVLLDARVVTSARRWEKRGYWKGTLKNLFWVVLYKLGLSPRWLADRY